MSNQKNLVLDGAILAAFLISYEEHLTGPTLHEWLSLGLFVTILVHVWLHWDWVAKVTAQFFRKFFHSSRLNYVVDGTLLVSFVTLMLSGFLISKSLLPTFGIQLAADRVWRVLHELSAEATVFLVGLHFALHWRWVVNTLRRSLAPVFRQLSRPAGPRWSVQPVRRDE